MHDYIDNYSGEITAPRCRKINKLNFHRPERKKKSGVSSDVTVTNALKRSKHFWAIVTFSRRPHVAWEKGTRRKRVDCNKIEFQGDFLSPINLYIFGYMQFQSRARIFFSPTTPHTLGEKDCWRVVSAGAKSPWFIGFINIFSQFSLA